MNTQELLVWTETRARELTGSAQAASLAQLDARATELTEFCETSLAQPETAHRLLAALARYWWLRGRASEGLLFAHRVFALTETVAPSLRARALEGAASLAYARAEFTLARSWWEQALALFEQENDPSRGRLYNQLGQVAREQARYDDATQLHQQALTLAVETNDRYAEALARSNLGVVALARGALDEARAHHTQALALRTALDDTLGRASSLGNLAQIARVQRAFETARSQLEEALALRRSLGDTWGASAALIALGSVRIEQGALDEAHALLREGVLGLFSVGDQLGLAEALEACALYTLHRYRERPRTALSGQLSATCLGNAAALRTRLGAPVPWHRREELERVELEVRAMLGDRADHFLKSAYSADLKQLEYFLLGEILREPNDYSSERNG